MSTTIVVIKNRVVNLLRYEERWTQNTSARNVEKESVLPDSPNAICWCLTGAIYKCYPNSDERYLINQMVYKELGQLPHNWNDDVNRTHDEVLELVTKLGI